MVRDRGEVERRASFAERNGRPSPSHGCGDPRRERSDMHRRGDCECSASPRRERARYARGDRRRMAVERVWCSQRDAPSAGRPGRPRVHREQEKSCDRCARVATLRSSTEDPHEVHRPTVGQMASRCRSRRQEKDATTRRSRHGSRIFRRRASGDGPRHWVERHRCDDRLADEKRRPRGHEAASLHSSAPRNAATSKSCGGGARPPSKAQNGTGTVSRKESQRTLRSLAGTCLPSHLPSALEGRRLPFIRSAAGVKATDALNLIIEP